MLWPPDNLNIISMNDKPKVRGRPIKYAINRKQYALRLQEEQSTKFELMCERCNKSQSEMFEQMVSEWEPFRAGSY
jgi:hypothetical protein